jgi:tape measure domain-containing protein
MGYSAASGAVISFSVDGVAASQRQIDSMEQSMTRLSERVQSSMRNLAAGVGLSGGLVEVAQLSDQYTKLTSQLKLATDSSFAYAAAYAQVKRIANDSQSDLGATGMLYARIANSTHQLSISQQQVGDITESVNLALKVSGATAEESASAQLQLSQAFAAGALRGEEFNAVNEAAPRLMQALADQMGVTRGELKQMASQGLITSKVMADALPRSLQQLREEAAQVNTIGGAFTVLKNKALEFTGVTAQSNGTVAVLTGGINLLSNNLNVLAVALGSVTAVKATNWIQSFTLETYRKIAADQAARAATLASAEAELAQVRASGAQAAAAQGAIVVARAEMTARLGQANANLQAAESAVVAASAAGTQSFAMHTLRAATAELATAETVRSAALAELATLGQQQVRVSAEIAAARAAEATATEAVTAAQAGASLGAGLATRAVALVGGPLGAIVTVLGIGATAWALWGNRAKESSTQAAESFEQSSQRILKGLDEQIKRNERLLQLRNQGMSKADSERSLPVVDQLAKASQRLDDINQRHGEFATKGDTDLFFERLKTLQAISDLSDKLQKANSSQAAVDASGTALSDLIEVRQRLSGVNKEYLDDLGKLQTAYEKGAIGQQEYVRLVSQLATTTWKSSEAGKAASAAAEKEQNAYAQLVVTVREKIDATAQEALGRGKLTEAQKLQVALDDQLRAGKLKLTPVDKAAYELLIKQLDANEQVIASQKRAAEGAEAMAAIVQALADARTKAIEDAQHEADNNEHLAATFGMSKAAIEAQELARLEDQLAQRASTAMTLDEIQTLEKLIDAKRRSAIALESLDAQEANKRSFDQMVADAKRAGDQISQSLTDDIMRGGKSGADYLRDLFRTLVLQPTVQGIMAPVATGFASAMLPTGTPGTPGAAGSNPLIGAATSAAGLYKAVGAGFDGLSASVTQYAQQGINLLGVNSGQYAGISSGMVSPAASMAGTAAGYGAGLLGGHYIGNAIAGEYSVNHGQAVTNIASIAGAIVGGPIGAAIGGAIGGLFNRAFGMGSTDVQAHGLRGTLTDTSLTGGSYQDLHQNGGWFRSDKDWETTTPFSAATVGQLTRGLSAIESASSSFASTLGVSAAAVTGYAKTFDLALTGDAGKDAQVLTELLAGIGDEIAKQLVPDIDKFSKSGETASATLERLSGDFGATNQVAQLLGSSAATLFGASGLDAAAARERLIDLAGGISTLSSEASFFNQNFLTDAERIKPVAAALDTALASLGLATIPTTRDEFKSLVRDLTDSGAAATETGAKQLDSLLALAEAFAQVHPALQGAADAASDAATKFETLKNAASAAYGDVDNSFSVLQKVVAREKAALQSRIDLETTAVNNLKSLSGALHSTLDGMRSPDQAVYDRLAAQAQIKTALAIARAGGPLPEADSLKLALSTIGQDASNQFATYADYLRDFYTTQLDVSSLAKYSDTQLSVEQQSLDTLQAQSKNLDDILANAQGEIDLLKGQSTTQLSMLQALEAIHSAILAAQNNPVVAATQAVNTEYQKVLGRAPDQAGLAYWQQQAATGTSISDIVQAIAGSPEATIRGVYETMLGGRDPSATELNYWLGQANKGVSLSAITDAIAGSDEAKKLHPFAVGTNYVPETMPALVHAGERIIPAADNRALMARLARPAEGDAALLQEVRAMRAELAQLRKDNSAENLAIAKHSMKAAEALDDAVNGARPLTTMAGS